MIPFVAEDLVALHHIRAVKLDKHLPTLGLVAEQSFQRVLLVIRELLEHFCHGNKQILVEEGCVVMSQVNGLVVQ